MPLQQRIETLEFIIALAEQSGKTEEAALRRMELKAVQERQDKESA